MTIARFLLLEDSPLDTELIHTTLLEAKIECELVQVSTREAFLSALSTPVDLILSDYALPSFDGISALEIARQRCPEVPFIFVSATLGEELAIETLKQGATDYVVKQRLGRLVPSVKRALKEAQERRDRQTAEIALQRSQERLLFCVEAANIGIWDLDPTSMLGRLSDRGNAILGVTSDGPIPYDRVLAKIHPDDRDRVDQVVKTAIRSGESFDLEFRIFWDDGSLHWLYSSGRAHQTATGAVAWMGGVLLDVTDRKQADLALRANEERLRGFVDANVIGILFGDVEGGIQDANDELLRIVGYTREDLQAGRLDWLAITPAEYLPLDVAGIAEAQARGACTPYEKEYIHKNGQRVPVLIGYTLIGDRRQHSVAFILDLTERKRLEQQLRYQAEELSHANRIKDEFLAVLSHELRTPMNPILGWSKLLRSRSFDEVTVQRALETIERNALIQTQLIEDLLDVSRILRGKLSLEIAPVDLVGTIAAALDTVSLAAEVKEIDLQFSVLAQSEPADASPPPQLLVSGDSGRLQQVVWNLLTNAIKFTEPGGRVLVQLTAIAGTGSIAYAELTVSDTGRGITSEFLPYVFDYFRQADGSTTRRFGGLGLGLAIVHHLVDLHGGTVSVSSDGADKGAKFTVRLPLLKMEVAAPDGSPAPPAIAVPLANVRVLVVDDESDARDLVDVILTQAGAIVQVATTATEAIQQMDRWRPDVLVSDIGMPEMDGYMLLRQIRQADEGQLPIPAIALTAYASPVDQQRTIAAGFQRHLCKPIEPTLLVEAVAAAIAHFQRPER